MKKYKWTIFYFLCLNFVFFLGQTAYGQTKDIKIYEFGVDSCSSCVFAKQLLTNIDREYNTRESEFIDDVAVEYHNSSAEKSLLTSYEDAFGVPENKRGIVPIVFIGDRYFVGFDDMRKNLKSVVEDYFEGKKQYALKPIGTAQSGNIHDSPYEKLDKFSVLAVVIAGLLDGFNPCAFAMLLFFLSFIGMKHSSGKRILQIGLCYILATFSTYLFIGLGLYSFASRFTAARPVLIVIYVLTIAMSFVIAILNLNDFIVLKKGKAADVKNQLPKAIRHRIHNFIRKNTVGVALCVSAFICGAVVSMLEFFCTGQIYLPTIVYVISLGTVGAKAVAYLILYNIAFVLPLVAVCFSVYFGKKITTVSNSFAERIQWIKLLGALFFLTISCYMIWKLTLLL